MQKGRGEFGGTRGWRQHPRGARRLSACVRCVPCMHGEATHSFAAPVLDPGAGWRCRQRRQHGPGTRPRPGRPGMAHTAAPGLVSTAFETLPSAAHAALNARAGLRGLSGTSTHHVFNGHGASGGDEVTPGQGRVLGLDRGQQSSRHVKVCVVFPRQLGQEPDAGACQAQQQQQDGGGVSSGRPCAARLQPVRPVQLCKPALNHTSTHALSPLQPPRPSQSLYEPWQCQARRMKKPP